MRWAFGILALIVVWMGYAGSPYYALYRLGTAIEARDPAAVAARVNIRALRVSLAKQLAGDITAAEAVGGGIASPDAQLAASAAQAFANPLLDEFVTPDGLIRLLDHFPNPNVAGSVFGTGRVEFDDLEDFLAASSWRGFRNVYFDLPPGTPKETRYRLQLRLGNLRWRVVSLDLPPDIRRSIVAEIVRRRMP